MTDTARRLSEREILYRIVEALRDDDNSYLADAILATIINQECQDILLATSIAEIDEQLAIARRLS